MPQIKEAKSCLGELFMIGFSGLEFPDDASAFFTQARIGGTILFAHNYESPAQVAELIQQVQEGRSELPLWVAVDQEGGKVQRFRKPFTILPDAATVARADSPKLTFELAEMMSRELKAVGVNVNFAPVADINTNPKNPVIGARAYGSEEEPVSKHVTAMVRGHLVSGVQPCVKHFPGHGDTSVDSHFHLPTVSTPLETLREREFRPFLKAFKSRCAMAMTAHIINPTIDPDLPGTLSEKTIQGLLRGELRYTKIIFSDDMEMKAIVDHFGAEEAPVRAIRAGCDILIYRSEEAGRHAYASALKAIESGDLPAARVIDAAQRSRALKKEALLPHQPHSVADAAKKVGLPEHQAIVDRILELSLKA